MNSNALARVLLFHQSQPKYNMKSLKCLLLVGALCAGMTPLAHATLTGPFLVTLHDNGQNTELTYFRNNFDAGAEMCVVQSPGNETVTNAFGTFTFVNSTVRDPAGHYTVTVTFTMQPGFLVCGFLTKNGLGNDVNYYTVSPDEGSSGTFVLEVPHQGNLSHIDVFCCAGEGVPDGGTTVMLLGTALGALGMARRYIRR